MAFHSTRPDRARALGRLRRAGCCLTLWGATLLGCASAVPPPIVSKAPLGRVIIYRNGVAYFQRYAAPSEKELTLRVPAERVDDFLKSLTIVDRKTGETMPVSYPTLTHSAGGVTMTIKLPEHHNGLDISYVTESPAWKPTYRLVLGKAGKARLQAWAVVDNVSGEDWKHVAVGVGSTSALSFRYDLHSIRLVERETLSSGSLLAAAPPTGGSPYAAGGKKMRVLANLREDALLAATVDDGDDDGKEADKTEVTGRRGPDRFAARGDFGAAGGRAGLGGQAQPMPSSKAARQAPAPPAAATGVTRSVTVEGRVSKPGELDTLAAQLSSSNERVRIEGFAQAGDKDPRTASLERANRLRNVLIQNGVPADRLEAVGTGKLDEQQAVRIVQVEGEPAPEQPVSEAPAAEGQPLGQAHFVSNAPMTIAKDHSAMVSILSAATKAERVYYYDPISSRGSKRFAFNAVRIENPSEYTLDSGPFTVYDEGQFLGEGLSEPILPRSSAFIPYALDRNIIVEPEITGREEIDELITIQRGIVTTETRKIRTTKLALTNRGKQPASIYVRHKLAPGHRLAKGITRFEKLGGALLFPVEVKGGETVELAIEEWTPVEKTVDIRTDDGIKAIGLYLKNARIDAALQRGLEQVVRRHTEGADLEERIELLEEQMEVYRARVDELNFQLVTLNKVTQAARLRKHLSEKMEEISDKLQAATMEVTELKGRLMTTRIELQDKLAELSLTKSGKAEKHARKE